MADGLGYTPGSGATVTTDDCGSPGHVQVMKLAISTDGSATLIPADATKGLAVNNRRTTVVAAVSSGGLTTATTAYTAGDQVGTLFTVSSSAVRASGGSGLITGVALFDKADIILGYEVVFFSTTVTLAADNAAFTLSDADAANIICSVPLPTATDFGVNRWAGVMGVEIPFSCAATTLYAALIARVGHTFFGATSDLILTTYIEQE